MYYVTVTKKNISVMLKVIIVFMLWRLSVSGEVCKSEWSFVLKIDVSFFTQCFSKLFVITILINELFIFKCTNIWFTIETYLDSFASIAENSHHPSFVFLIFTYVFKSLKVRKKLDLKMLVQVYQFKALLGLVFKNSFRHL